MLQVERDGIMGILGYIGCLGVKEAGLDGCCESDKERVILGNRWVSHSIWGYGRLVLRWGDVGCLGGCGSGRVCCWCCKEGSIS